MNEGMSPYLSTQARPSVPKDAILEWLVMRVLTTPVSVWYCCTNISVSAKSIRSVSLQTVVTVSFSLLLATNGHTFLFHLSFFLSFLSFLSLCLSPAVALFRKGVRAVQVVGRASRYNFTSHISLQSGCVFAVSVYCTLDYPLVPDISCTSVVP